MIGTALLGIGTIAEITAPGSFPVDPFFFQIAVLYALPSVGGEPPPGRSPSLAGRSPARARCAAGDVIHLCDRRHHQLFTSLCLLPIIAASVGTESSRRDVRRRLERLALCRSGRHPVLCRLGLLHDPWLATERQGLPSHAWRSIPLRSMSSAFSRWRCSADRSPKASVPPRLRLEVASGRIADLRPQSACHRQPAKRARHSRRGTTHSDFQPRRRGDHRPVVFVGRRTADRRCPATAAGVSRDPRPGLNGAAVTTPRDQVSDAGPARDRHRSDRDLPPDARQVAPDC